MHKNIQILSSWALYKKEVKRFLKVFNQTIISPIITALIYLAIFNIAIGSRNDKIASISFNEFIASGLIIMTSMQNAFSNTSSSIMISKINKTILDYIIPPFSAKGITLALGLSGATRGIIVGIATALVLAIFANIKIYSVFHCILYLILASFMLALIGIVTSIFSDTFEQMSMITTYVITPLSFLSGTFYSVNMLPDWAKSINYYNPFFFIIDGFRYSLTSYHDASLTRGASIIIINIIILYVITLTIFEKGWKLKN